MGVGFLATTSAALIQFLGPGTLLFFHKAGNLLKMFKEECNGMGQKSLIIVP